MLAALVCAPLNAAHAAPNPPELNIAVDGGRATAARSDELSYAIKVTNLGTSAIKDLIITQTVPDGATLGTTDPSATAKATTLSWSVDIGPGRSAPMKTTVTVDETLPDGLLR